MQGAKDLFIGQLNAASGITPNLGLAYSIELLRDGKIYKVDNRFPFRSGDQIRFHVRPNVDGFMYIVLDSENSNNPMLMFPRRGDEQNAVKKGEEITLPEKGRLTFDDVAGTESLKLVLSQKALELKPDTTVIANAGRSVVVHEKQSSDNFPSHFKIDFDALDPSRAIAFDTEPTSTMVTTAVEKPLVVDLLLKHQPREHSGTVTASGAAVTGSSPVTDKWAVVIGISKFKNPRWDLNYPDKDAKDFANFLVQKCNFSPDHVRVLTDQQATRERILTDIGSHWLPMNAKPNDLVCIYIATHGTAANLDVARHNFLMAHDTDPLNPFATGIELQDLSRNVVRRLQSKRVVLILDTCHSGAVELAGAKALPSAATFDMKDLLQGTGHLVIASAGANQIAHDSARYKNGIFTKHLMDGLSKHSKLHDAFQYAQQHVAEESSTDYKEPQIPVLKDAEWKGEELKIAVPPLSPRKPNLN